MLRKLLWIIAALLMTVGCDDPTVHSLITSNFVCVYMPYWMGECDSEAMSAKAQSVLTDGIIAAKVSCSGNYLFQKKQGDSCGSALNWGDVNVQYTYRAVRLQEGACYVNWSSSGHTNTSDESSDSSHADVDIIARSQSEAIACSVNLAANVHASVAGGNLTIHSEATSYYRDGSCPDPQATPDTVVSLTSESCTGFNLAAFGVSE